MSTAALDIEHDVPLGPLTTYRTGGPARIVATVHSAEGVEELIDGGYVADHEILILGRGSNLVVSERGFDGLVVKLAGEFGDISVSDDVVTAGGAAPLARVARTAVDSGVQDLEFLVGVPGSMGGAVRQNAGCFGVEVSDRLVTAELIDLRTGGRRSSSPEALDLSYRHSNVGPTELVISARLQGRIGVVTEGKKLMREITRWRKENQPGGTLNAGSVFKNPEGISAGELIDNLGLKGTEVGDVSVSTKHANFFVARPGASADDIFRLVQVVKDTVFERSGTMLETEIQFVGFER